MNLKAAVIGLGQIGLMYDFDSKRTLPSSHTIAYDMNPSIDLVCATDIREESREKLRQKTPYVEYYKNVECMLRKNKNIDIISICTPPETHLELLKIILELSSPKVIFCEKPVVSSIDEVKYLYELIKGRSLIFIPNLSRRWNEGIYNVYKFIDEKKYGDLQKINIRYTRGIYNTGSHIFDLIHWFAGKIKSVQVIEEVYSTSKIQQEPTFSFIFEMDNEIKGFAEGFNDEQYYLFEIDLYFSQGKIEIRNSANDVYYYKVAEHPLFSGFKSLHLEKHETNLLAQSNLKNTVEHIVRILDSTEQPICNIEDGIYPLYVADALLRSYQNNGSKEEVEVFKNE